MKDWKPKTLDTLGFVGRGKSKHRPRDAEHLYGGRYPFIQTGDVKHAGLYITSYSQTYSEAGLKQSKIWETGTLCITIAANIADTAILKFDACFPDSIIGFIPHPEKADTRFIKYLFDATLQKQFKPMSKGSTQDNLSQAKLLSLELKIPNVKQQQKIASILSAYDDLIENNRRRIQLLEQSAQMLYKEWFVRLRFPGYEHTKIIDNVPEEWILGTVADLGEVITGKTPSKNVDAYYGNDVLFVKTPDMHANILVIDTVEKLSFEGSKSQANKLLPPRSILVSCIGSAGVVAMNAIQAQTNQQINSIVFDNEILRNWAFFTAQTFKPLLDGMGGGATMTNVNKSKFEKIKVVIPSKRVLKDFTLLTENVINQIELLIKQNHKLAAARDALLPRLMNGEMEV